MWPRRLIFLTLSSSSICCLIGVMSHTPVTFLSPFLSDDTRPALTGSVTAVNTIGIPLRVLTSDWEVGVATPTASVTFSDWNLLAIEAAALMSPLAFCTSYSALIFAAASSSCMPLTTASRAGCDTILETPIRTFFGASAAKTVENSIRETSRTGTTRLKHFFIVRLLKNIVTQFLRLQTISFRWSHRQRDYGGYPGSCRCLASGAPAGLPFLMRYIKSHTGSSS